MSWQPSSYGIVRPLGYLLMVLAAVGEFIAKQNGTLADGIVVLVPSVADGAILVALADIVRLLDEIRHKP